MGGALDILSEEYVDTFAAKPQKYLFVAILLDMRIKSTTKVTKETIGELTNVTVSRITRVAFTIPFHC